MLWGMMIVVCEGCTYLLHRVRRSAVSRALLEVLTGGLPAVTHLGDLDTAAWVRASPSKFSCLTCCFSEVKQKLHNRGSFGGFDSIKPLTSSCHEQR